MKRLLPFYRSFQNLKIHTLQLSFTHRLDANPSLILLYEREDVPIGFKCGYEREGGSQSFYSWMGGVVPAHRKRNVARDLLLEMEEWCRKHGYRELTFKTYNTHKAMLIFAIKNDFRIIEVEKRADSTPRIWCAKKLT